MKYLNLASVGNSGKSNIYQLPLKLLFRFGEKCLYVDDCEDDSDCNSNGKCLQRSSTSIPR